MAKRILFVALMTGLLVMVFPAATIAQDAEAVWDLSDKFTVQDLGFEFYYPSGWYYDTSNGITFAETKADLRAAIDNDDSTQPDNTTFQLIAFPKQDIENRLGKNPTLEEFADLVVELAALTEKEARIEIPVMARRTISIFGEDSSRIGQIATMWQQSDYGVVAIMTAPSFKVAVNTAYSWGQMLGSMTPTGALVLSDNTLSLEQVNATIGYPDGWYPSPDNPGLVYELKSDMKNGTGEGHLIVIVEQTLDELGLSKRADVEDVAEINIENLKLKGTVRREEFILFEQPALLIAGSDGKGQYGAVVQVIIDGVAVQVALVSPSEEAFREVETTFLAMLTTLA